MCELYGVHCRSLLCASVSCMACIAGACCVCELYGVHCRSLLSVSESCMVCIAGACCVCVSCMVCIAGGFLGTYAGRSSKPD